jgi:hypothetical protein
MGAPRAAWPDFELVVTQHPNGFISLGAAEALARSKLSRRSGCAFY